ncbi:MAG: hypothetical protein JWQ19_1401, partial [Subtercola sp.]|nr:hypothetical protein [Subtercola sp.]
NDVLSTDPSQWQIQQGYPPPNGTLVMDDHTGAFTFTPAPGYSGVVTFKYILVGTGPYVSGATSTPAIVTIHVG